MQTIAGEISREAAIVAGSPALFIAGLVVIALGLWAAINWQYSSRIERLKQDVTSWREDAIRLRERLAEPQANPQPASPIDPERSDRQRSIQLLRAAAQAYGLAKADALGRDDGRLAPTIRSALLTAQKAFGLPIPPEAANPRDDATQGKRYLDLVLPFLESGHDEEARGRADDFVRDLRH